MWRFKLFGQTIKINYMIYAVFILLMLTGNHTANAAGIIRASVQQQQYNFSGLIVKNLNLNFNSDPAWNLYVKPVGNCLVNASDPSNQISINRITFVSHSKENRLNPETALLIDSGENSGSISKQFSIKLMTQKGNKPGIYSGNLQFILSSPMDKDIYTVPITFEQPVYQHIEVIPTSFNIDIDNTQALNKNLTQKFQSPHRIYIQSNTKWQLILESKNDDKSLKYLFKVQNVPKNSYTKFGSNYTDLPENKTIIAEGEASASNNANLEPQIVEISYLLKSQGNKVEKAGKYHMTLKYNLTHK